MREELITHKLILSFVVLWLIIYLVTLFAFGVHKSDTWVEAEAVILLTIVVAAALSYVGIAAIVAAVNLGFRHRREIAAYGTLGLLGLAMASVLTFTIRESVALIAVTVAPFPLLFGLAEMRLAAGFSRHGRQARALAICGAVEFGCGVLLAVSHTFDEVHVMRVLALTAFITLLQLLPFLAFRPHDFQRIENHPCV